MSEGFQRNWRRREELPVFEPPGQHGPPPKQINSTRRQHNVLYVAGKGPRPAPIMFIMPGLLEDDAREGMMTSQFHIAMEPCYMKSQAGVMFKDVCEQAGLPPNEMYFTALCKWLLPKARRKKPNADDIAWAEQSLEAEIREVQPKIIVCLGKAVLDHLFELKLRLSDVEGGWLRCEKYGCLLYAMDDVERPLMRPEFLEKFRVDLIEVRKMLDLLAGKAPPKVPLHYEVITNSRQLMALVSRLAAGNFKVLSVDGEWGGKHHVDGELRSLQICWAPGCAAYIKLMDENGEYVFDVSYKEAGRILGIWLNQPFVKYIGHQLVADLVWMHHVLGLDIYRKAVWDTLYAMQCIDENQDAGLERLAMAYTDLGRYDIDLVIWKKQHKLGEDEGYKHVPDAIMEAPGHYGCKDVDVVFRTWKPQYDLMLAQGQALVDYFYSLFLPFVTDVFAEFTLCGLPMDVVRLDRLREVFLLARKKLEENLRTRIAQEARLLLLGELSKIDPVRGLQTFLAIQQAMATTDTTRALETFRAFVPVDKVARLTPFYEHYLDAPAFNIRSVDQMRRWLFAVKGFTPIKSTNNKEKGLPATSWDRVLRMSEAAQREFKPSTDKQTLKVLAEKDSLVMELLQLNAVGNLTKAFLRPADYDDEGNLVKENGLHYWIASDGRVHGQFATTETGRPRSWKPNSLNWPSWVNNHIAAAIARLVKEEPEGSEFRVAYDRLMQGKTDGKSDEPPSIRSSISAQAVPAPSEEEGWVLVESDYQTAEVRGLAYISGDDNLIRLMNEDDPQFAAVAGGDLEKDRVRLCYAPDYGIPPGAQNPDFILTKWEFIDPKKPDAGIRVLKRYAEADLHRNPDGTIWHPKHDLHWSLAERTMQKPRELLHKKRHRDGLGKTGNFKSAYGSSEDAMERSIEAETGEKPAEGTGAAILKALAERQPVADAFLKALELVPDNEKVMHAASGRIRHFKTHDKDMFVSKRLRDKVTSGLARESRNFLMQESVAATSARAGIWLTHYYRTHGMQARIITILYDSVVTLCRLKERFAVKELHQLFMCDINQWRYGNRVLNYPIDTEFNHRWSSRPSKADQKKLDDPAWHNDAALHRQVLADAQLMRQAGVPLFAKAA